MSDWTRRPRAGEFAPRYAGYVAGAPAGDLRHALEEQRAAVLRLDGLPAAAEAPYAPGKWSLREWAGHLGDTERLLHGRALAVARGDLRSPPEYDDDAYVAAAAFDRRPLADWTAAFDRERGAFLAWLQSLEEEALDRPGSEDGRAPGPRTVGWILAGHVARHLAVLRERYLEPRGLDPWAPLALEADGGLALVEPRLEDAAGIFALADAERDRLERWLPWVPATRDPADTAAFLRSMARRRALGTDWVFRLVAGGRLLGMVGLHQVRRGHKGEIGYWISAEGEGRGRVSAAVVALARWARAELGLRRLTILCEPENRRSRALPERLGFVDEGRHRDSSPPHPGRDVIVYAHLEGVDPPIQGDLR